MATLFDDETRAVEHNSRLSENYRVIFGDKGNESSKGGNNQPNGSASNGERNAAEEKTRNEEIKKVLSTSSGYGFNGANYFSYNPYRTHTINQDRPADSSPSVSTVDTSRPTMGTSSSHSFIRAEGGVRAPEKIEERPAPVMPKSLHPVRGRGYDYSRPVIDEVKEPVRAVRVDVPSGDIRPVGMERREGKKPVYGNVAVSRTPKTFEQSAPIVKEQPQNAEGKVGHFFSTQAKVVVAVFVAVIMIAFTVIFVNSALLNSLDGELAEKETLMAQVSQEADSYLAQVKEATDKETIIAYAREAGMIFE